jgi:hypothetical protein
MDDPHFVPGSLKYGDLAALIALASQNKQVVEANGKAPQALADWLAK